jgi:hypothetical protein
MTLFTILGIITVIATSALSHYHCKRNRLIRAYEDREARRSPARWGKKERIGDK